MIAIWSTIYPELAMKFRFVIIISLQNLCKSATDCSVLFTSAVIREIFESAYNDAPKLMDALKTFNQIFKRFRRHGI